MFKPAWALLWAVVALPAIVSAGDTVQYGPQPDWVHALEVPANASVSTGAPARSLLKNFQIKFTATTSEVFSEAYVRIQTPQGLQAMGNIILPWKPDSDVLTVHRFRLLRGKEIIDILANGQKFEVLRREHNLEYSALDGVLSAALQPNGMEVGDVLDVAFTLKREYRTVQTPEFVLGGLVEAPPVENIEVRAIWDKSVPVKWRASAEVVGATEKRDGNSRELRWAATELAALDQPGDVPVRFFREPLIEFSTLPSWNELSRQLAPLYIKAVELAPDSPLKAEAATIAAASADPVRRLEAALKLAQERVRYVFLGMAEGNIKPANADETWQRRFGDCKGKTALLIALLRELGISAEPVAVNTRVGDAVSSHLPLVSAFDHVIVRAQAGGKTWWLDGAGSGSWHSADMQMPNYHWGLPLTAQSAGLIAMDAPPAAEPQMVVETDLDARAGLHTEVPFKVFMRLGAPAGAGLHAQLAQQTPAAREQVLKKYWKNEYDFVEPKTVAEEFDENTGYIKVSMEGSAHMDWSGYSYVTDGMRTGERVDFKRENAINADAPFVIAHPLYKVTRQRIALPATGTFTLKGSEYDAELVSTRYVRHAKLEKRVFTGEVSVRSLASEVTAAKARAAQRALNDMWADKLEIVATDYSPNDADVVALRGRKFDDVPNLTWRGNVFLDHGDYADALRDFDAAVKLEPKKARPLALRGLARYWQGDYVAARTDLDAALVLDPRSAVALRGLGAVDYQTGKLPEAVAHLSESIKIDPGESFAYSIRADVYAAMDESAKALEDAAEAVRLSPTFVDMYALRAWIFATDGRSAEALQELAAMQKIATDKPRVQWHAAQTYARLGRYADAVTAMNQYVAAHPEVLSYVARANVRDPADAVSRLGDVELALAKDPTNADLLTSRAELLGESGDHAAAIAQYSAQIKKLTALTAKRRLLSQRGVEYAQVGKQAEARRDFAAALADDPDGDAYSSHCWVLAAARLELQSALEACDKALQVAPKDASYLDSRGLVLLQLGRLDEAIASYDAALALKPKQAQSLYGRGIAKNRRCHCADGNADMSAGARRDPRVQHVFSRAKLDP